MAPQFPRHAIAGWEHGRAPPAWTIGIAEAGAIRIGDVVTGHVGRTVFCAQGLEPGPELGQIGNAVYPFRPGECHARLRARRALRSRILSWTAGRKPASSKSANQRSGVMNG